MKAELPLLLSFQDSKSLTEAMNHGDTVNQINEIERLLAVGLPPVISHSSLATMLGVSVNIIQYIVRHPSKMYDAFELKKGRKVRQISAPRVALKVIQSWFSVHLAKVIPYPNSVVGFRPGVPGVFEGASRHCQASWVLNLDIKDFFDSINRERLKRPLLELGYTEKSADLVLDLCTLSDQLPQGAPSSPPLSNLAFMRTDKQLEEVCSRFKVKYTRYADDLIFSGKGEFPEGFDTEIKDVLAGNDWEMAESKEQLVYAPKRLKVLGLIVNDAVPKLTKGYRNKVRAYKHVLSSKGSEADNFAVLQGHIAYHDSLVKFNSD